MAIFHIWGDFPVEKPRLKTSSSSCLAFGPKALRNVGGYLLALGCHRVRPFARQHSNFLLQSLDFSGRMRFLSSLLKRRWLTAAYTFMKALALLWLVVKIRTFCGRGSANVVEEGVIQRHDRPPRADRHMNKANINFLQLQPLSKLVDFGRTSVCIPLEDAEG